MNKLFKSIIPLSFLLFNSISLSLASADRTFLYDYEGNVIILRNNQGLALKSDIPILQKDILKTDVEGTADIIFNQLAGIRFYGNSECLFTDIQSSTTYLEMSQGFALCSLRAMPSGGDFRIETPTAIIVSDVLVRYSCRIENEGEKTKTTIAIKKGKLRVQIKSSHSTIDLLAGQGLDVTNDSFITSARDLTEDENKILFKTTAIVVSDEIPD